MFYQYRSHNSSCFFLVKVQSLDHFCTKMLTDFYSISACPLTCYIDCTTVYFVKGVIRLGCLSGEVKVQSWITCWLVFILFQLVPLHAPLTVPQFTLSKELLDFGVCLVGYKYKVGSLLYQDVDWFLFYFSLSPYMLHWLYHSLFCQRSC